MSGPLPPVVLLLGDDDVLLERRLEALLTEIREREPDLELTFHDAAELDGLPELRTSSLFGARSGAVVRGAAGMTGDLRREVADYVARPNPDAVLVLVANGKGRLGSIVADVEAAGGLQQVAAPRDWDDRGWDRVVGDEFRRAGRMPSRGAVAAIRDHAGADTAAIASKVAQVVAATEDGAQVDGDDVDAVVTGHGRVSGFAIADAVATRDPAKLLVALRGALEGGEAPLAILGSVAYRYRQLLQVRAGVRPPRMSSGQYKFLGRLAASFGPGELARGVDRLARLDLELKGSDLPPELALEVGLLELTTPRADSA